LSSFYALIPALALPVKAIAAVHRPIATGLERDLRRHAAAITDDFEHLALAARAALPALGTAAGATAGLILKTLLRVEVLLRSGEHKFGAAIATGQSFVLVH